MDDLKPRRHVMLATNLEMDAAPCLAFLWIRVSVDRLMFKSVFGFSFIEVRAF